MNLLIFVRILQIKLLIQSIISVWMFCLIIESKLLLMFFNAIKVCMVNVSSFVKQKLTPIQSFFMKKSKIWLRFYMGILLKLKEKSLWKDFEKENSEHSLQLMSHQEVLIFQTWSLSFKWNHQKTQKLTFTDQEELPEQEQMEIASLFILLKTTIWSLKLKTRLVLRSKL